MNILPANLHRQEASQKKKGDENWSLVITGTDKFISLLFFLLWCQLAAAANYKDPIFLFFFNYIFSSKSFSFLSDNEDKNEEGGLYSEIESAVT